MSLNTRYLAYCAEQGRTPREQMAHDAHLSPAWPMNGFVAWARDRWAEFHALTSRRYLSGREAECGGEIVTDEGHRAFDAWLRARGNVSPENPR